MTKSIHMVPFTVTASVVFPGTRKHQPLSYVDYIPVEIPELSRYEIPLALSGFRYGQPIKDYFVRNGVLINSVNSLGNRSDVNIKNFDSLRLSSINERYWNDLPVLFKDFPDRNKKDLDGVRIVSSDYDIRVSEVSQFASNFVFSDGTLLIPVSEPTINISSSISNLSNYPGRGDFNSVYVGLQNQDLASSISRELGIQNNYSLEDTLIYDWSFDDMAFNTEVLRSNAINYWNGKKSSELYNLPIGFINALFALRDSPSDILADDLPSIVSSLNEVASGSDPVLSSSYFGGYLQVFMEYALQANRLELDKVDVVGISI